MSHFSNYELSQASQKLFHLIFSKITTQCIGVVANLGIADMLRAGSCSIKELAKNAQVNQDNLYRVMRALVSVGIFTELEPKKFALNDLAEPLCSDSVHTLKDFAIFVADPVHNKAHSALLHSVKTGETGFDFLFGMDSFSYLKTDSEFMKVFNAAMTSISHRDAKAVINSYDFSSFNTLVDVGGGNGFLLTEVLKKTPGLQGLLFELPEVAFSAQSVFEQAGVFDRVEIVAGNFFEEIPVVADAFMMKYVLHDWNDVQAVTILKNCANSMQAGGKILVIDNVVPEDNASHLGKIHDIEMMVMTGGKERTQTEFKQLFASAGLKLQTITATETSLSIIEAIGIT